MAAWLLGWNASNEPPQPTRSHDESGPYHLSISTYQPLRTGYKDRTAQLNSAAGTGCPLNIPTRIQVQHCFSPLTLHQPRPCFLAVYLCLACLAGNRLQLTHPSRRLDPGLSLSLSHLDSLLCQAISTEYGSVRIHTHVGARPFGPFNISIRIHGPWSCCQLFPHPVPQTAKPPRTSRTLPQAPATPPKLDGALSAHPDPDLKPLPSPPRSPRAPDLEPLPPETSGPSHARPPRRGLPLPHA